MDSFRRLWAKSNTASHDKWKIIGLSVLAATTFWFFNALNKSDYTTTINYPIELSYPGKDSLLVVGKLPRTLRINVTGGGWNLIRNSLGIGAEPLQVKLNDPTERRYLLGSSLAPQINEQVTIFRLNSIITDSLHFQIQRKGHRRLKVVIKDVNLAQDYVVVGEILIDPDTVDVTGPLSLLNSLSDSLILNLQEEEINRAYEKDIAVEIEQEQIHTIPSQVKIQFEVEKMSDQERIVQITPRNFPEGYTIDIDSVGQLVRFKVLPSLMDSIGLNTIQVIADFDEMQSDSTITLRVQSTGQFVKEVMVDSKLIRVIHQTNN